MLGSAVSSSTPNDFQPNSHMGVLGSCPLMNLHASSGCPKACVAVGMQRAVDSATGLPSRSISAPWMLAFLMPADVRRNLMGAPSLAVGVVLPSERLSRGATIIGRRSRRGTSPNAGPSECTRPSGERRVLPGTDDFRAAVVSEALATGHRTPRPGERPGRKGEHVTKVVAIMSMSLDGYVADANDGVA